MTPPEPAIEPPFLSVEERAAEVLNGLHGTPDNRTRAWGVYLARALADAGLLATDDVVSGDDLAVIWWPVDMTTAEMVEWCQHKRMTVQEIADRCGVSRRAVTAWASGVEASYPHKSALWALAKGARKGIA